MTAIQLSTDHFAWQPKSQSPGDNIHWWQQLKYNVLTSSVKDQSIEPTCVHQLETQDQTQVSSSNWWFRIKLIDSPRAKHRYRRPVGYYRLEVHRLVRHRTKHGYKSKESTDTVAPNDTIAMTTPANQIRRSRSNTKTRPEGQVCLGISRKHRMVYKT